MSKLKKCLNYENDFFYWISKDASSANYDFFFQKHIEKIV